MTRMWDEARDQTNICITAQKSNEIFIKILSFTYVLQQTHIVPKYEFLYKTKTATSLNELIILKELEQIVKEKQPTREPEYMGTPSI